MDSGQVGDVPLFRVEAQYADGVVSLQPQLEESLRDRADAVAVLSAKLQKVSFCGFSDTNSM